MKLHSSVISGLEDIPEPFRGTFTTPPEPKEGTVKAQQASSQKPISSSLSPTVATYSSGKDLLFLFIILLLILN
jgi:hypothetical protein